MGATVASAGRRASADDRGLLLTRLSRQSVQRADRRGYRTGDRQNGVIESGRPVTGAPGVGTSTLVDRIAEGTVDPYTAAEKIMGRTR